MHFSSPIRRSGRQSRRALLCAAAALFLALGADAATTVSYMTGKVSRQRAGGPWEPVVVGAVVQTGDVLSTAGGGRATLSFDDGTRVDLAAGSSLVIKDASAQHSQLDLAVGKLKAWVAKVKSRRFDVKTPTAVCSVRGTEFEVGVDRSGQTNVQMFEGMLAVSDGRGNETLVRDHQSITVTDRGLGSVSGDSRDTQSSDRSKDAYKREVGLEMSKEEVQAAAAQEAKNAVYQEGKAIVDVNGNRVRIEEYIIRPQPDQFKLVVLNSRVDRFDYFYYKGTFNTTLPDDLSIALRQLPGCIGAQCQYWLTNYETARSNTTDNMLEVASGGHQIDVNNDGCATDRVEAAYDPGTDQFASLNVPNPGGVGNDPYFKTLFDNYSLSFNGIVHSQWAPVGGPGVLNTSNAQVNYTNVTTVQNPPACAPPNCTYTEDGVLHQVIFASDNTGLIWEKYDSYIISDEGRIANTADFNGLTSGASYKANLLKWNFQMIVTASEFKGRKIDLAVEPKIFIQSGLIP